MGVVVAHSYQAGRSGGRLRFRGDALIHVVRHAKAGNPGDWGADDSQRPLTKAGRRQAEALALRAAGLAVRRVLSSPYRRCVQTVEPLAGRLGLEVETRRELVEGAGGQAALELVWSLSGVEAVLCSHGDVILELLDRLRREGVVAADPWLALEKASTWTITETGGRFTSAQYVSPPN